MLYIKARQYQNS